MSLVSLGKSRRLAKEHLRDVFRDYFSSFIATARAGSSLTPKPKMLVPTDGSVYLTNMDQPDALPRNENIFVYIFEDGPRTTERTNSGGNGFVKKQTEQDFRIMIVFRYSLEDGLVDPDGIAPQPDEIMIHKCDLYLEAAVDMLSTHGRSPSAIHDIDLIDDQQFPLYDEAFPVLGVCAMTWRITQMATVPQSIC